MDVSKLNILTIFNKYLFYLCIINFFFKYSLIDKFICFQKTPEKMATSLRGRKRKVAVTPDDGMYAHILSHMLWLLVVEYVDSLGTKNCS